MCQELPVNIQLSVNNNLLVSKFIYGFVNSKHL